MTRGERSSIARGFLFADLRGYSAYVERHGDRAGVELLTTYRDLVRRTVPRFSGAEIRTEGDSFYVVFTSPSAALECGLAILDEASRTTTSGGAPIAVGIGVHAGETMELDDAYVGSAVNIAARICSIASAGQLLTTEAVRSLTRSYLGVTFVPVGRRRLKGITDPVYLYQVLAEGEAPARGRVGRWASPITRRRLALVAPFAGVGIAAIAILLTQTRGVVDPTADATPPPLAPSAPVDQGQLAGATGAAASAEDGAFPTSGESRLLALVEEQFQPSCERAAEDARPMYTHLVGTVRFQYVTAPVPVSAEVVCAPFGSDAPDELAFWTIASTAVNATELLLNIAGTEQATVGPCEGELPAQEAWSVGPVSGRRACFAEPATIYWTYDGADILARATRLDGDIDALLTWWEDEARLRRP